MDTTAFADVYAAPGPFATVLIDVSHDDEGGRRTHELRVRDACDRLAEQGADEAVVRAVADRLGELVARPSPVSRLVVAAPDGIRYDEVAAARTDRPVATWAPLPDLSAWVDHLDSSVTFVLAVVDHEGGDVSLMRSDVPEPEDETSIHGETDHIHKVPTGGWSALRYQKVTENVWSQNARTVAEEITRQVRAGHRLVLLAGDPHSKSLVRDELGDLPVDLVELDTGSRAEDGGDQALQQAVREALMDVVVTRRVHLIHELRERTGRGESVATGIEGVADAFVRGQVDTLLLDPAGAAAAELAPSRHPGLTFGATTPDGPVRADLGLVAAAVATDARIAVLPSAALSGEPVAALLRWDQAPDTDGARG